MEELIEKLIDRIVDLKVEIIENQNEINILKSELKAGHLIINDLKLQNTLLKSDGKSGKQVFTV